MPLFEVAIIEVKVVKEEDKEKLVLGPIAFVAKDSHVAGMKALMDNTAELKGYNLDHLKVLVRPFVSLSGNADKGSARSIADCSPMVNAAYTGAVYTGQPVTTYSATSLTAGASGG